MSIFSFIKDAVDVYKEVSSNHKTSEEIEAEEKEQRRIEKEHKQKEQRVRIKIAQLSREIKGSFSFQSICGMDVQELLGLEQNYRISYIDTLAEAKELEKTDLKEAVKIYEHAIEERWGITASPYIQLAKIYRKEERYDDEIRVLEKGILFLAEYENYDLAEKLYPRLEKAILLRGKPKKTEKVNTSTE